MVSNCNSSFPTSKSSKIGFGDLGRGGVFKEKLQTITTGCAHHKYTSICNLKKKNIKIKRFGHIHYIMARVIKMLYVKTSMKGRSKLYCNYHCHFFYTNG